MKPRARLGLVLASLALAVLIAGGLGPVTAQLKPAALPPPPPEPDPPRPEEVVVIDAFAYDPEVEVARVSGTQAQIEAHHAAAALEAARPGRVYKVIQLSGLLAVRVSNPQLLFGEGDLRCSDLRLTFDGTAFGSNVPYRCTADLVIYNLALLDRAQEPAWTNLVKKRRGVRAFTNISLIGPDDEEPLTSQTTDREIRLYNSTYARIALIGFAGVLWGFVRLARRSNLIRDGGKKSSEQDHLRPYSLARVQTAWWFFLVLFAFIFISLLDGTLANIPNSILGLMGIAGGTFLGSELVDSSRRNRPENRNKPNPIASRQFTGFFKDIFSDAGGVAFHRFQMFVWTLALGVIFVIRVLRNLHMPEFETSVLGLMGISSGTYLGMKIPETPKAEGADHSGEIDRQEGQPLDGPPPER